MNEYNYDYLGINKIIPNSIPISKNNIPNNFNIDYNQNNSNILNPNEGFIRGNIFNNLYKPYKNYKPLNLDPKTEKETMLMNIMQYNFTLNDLDLYLDIYPNDISIINLYKQYLNIIKNIKNEYEKKYGPLTSDSININNNKWEWINNPWPWEVI